MSPKAKTGITSPKLKKSRDARKAALHILGRLDQGMITLDRLLENYLSDDVHPKGRDLSLFYALIYGVLRWRARLDWIIAHFSKTALSKIDPDILNILRLGLFQITFLDRIPDSAAVHTAVEMAKSTAVPWTAGFVNGILRNVARGHTEVPFPASEDNPIAFLSTKKSFPAWIIRRWLLRFGFEKTESLCDALNQIPPITLRTNTLKTTREPLMASLEKDAVQLEPTGYAPEGIRLYGPVSSIPDMESFRSGWFQVQDEAAQLVTHLLNPRPGEAVLDACAGLGGKTGHIAQMMQNKGDILCMDINPPKLTRLQLEMKRIGVTIVSVITHDLKRPLGKKVIAPFDRILLDAPCSGLGILRRNPDARWNTAKKNLARYQHRQVRFLENLADLLKPGGNLVYAVCSPEPEENEDVIDLFIKKRPDFVIDKNPIKDTGPLPKLIDRDGFLRTFPEHPDMDGFFCACLRKT